MSSQPSWQPNIPESQLFDEKTWLQGAILSAVAYGINLTLFILNVSLLSARAKLDIKRDSRVSRQTTCLLIYICVIFILCTLGVASQAKLTQLGFVENRDFPGGPAAYQEIMFSIPISKLGTYCFTLMGWIADILLLWRCSIIYQSSRTSLWLVMALPGLLMLASFISGIIYLDKMSYSPWQNTTLTYIYAITSFSLNIVLTLMIVIRLYLHRRNITKLLGHRHAVHYTSIITMIIESAAILDVMVIFFLIPFVMGNPIANISIITMVQIPALTSYMIIFRVAKGTAWTSQTTVSSEYTTHGMHERPGNVSALRFRPTTIDHSANSGTVTLQSRNQFPLDGPLDLLDPESNSHGAVYGSHTLDPADIIEKVGPNAN